jgi:hypothetical protein
MTERSIVVDAAIPARDGLPAAPRSRPEEEERAQRVGRLVAQLGEHARSPLIDPRFVDGSRGLALALTGLAAMRANDFAAALAEELARRLETVLSGTEEQVAAALPALAVAQGRGRRGRTWPGRRARQGAVRDLTCGER